MTAAVDAVVEGLPPVAARQLAQLLASAVRDASYDVHPDAQVFVRELRAWSLTSAQRDAPRVFRNTPPGVPVFASSTGCAAPSAHDVIGISEAARRLGVSTGLLRRHCRRGRYNAVKDLSGTWWLDVRAVDAHAAERG